MLAGLKIETWGRSVWSHLISTLNRALIGFPTTALSWIGSNLSVKIWRHPAREIWWNMSEMCSQESGMIWCLTVTPHFAAPRLSRIKLTCSLFQMKNKKSALQIVDAPCRLKLSCVKNRPSNLFKVIQHKLWETHTLLILTKNMKIVLLWIVNQEVAWLLKTTRL